jgi:SAM-dependent methyltransferase
MKILDVGCGDGARINNYLYRRGACVGVDTDEGMLRDARRRARPGARFVRAPAERLPFPAASFDEVYCFDVLEHVRDAGRAVREIARVLRRGGRAVIGVPHPRSEGVVGSFDPEYFSPKMHLRVFTRASLASLLGRNGLRVVRAEGRNFFDALAVTYQSAARLGFQFQSGRPERRNRLFSLLEALGFLERSSLEELRLKLESMRLPGWLFPLVGAAHLALWAVGRVGALFYPKSLYLVALREAG